jgi:AraC-like DNA-binding protein
MNNWKTLALLLAASQGIILSLALFSPRKKIFLSNVFLGLLVLIVSLELLNDWGLKTRYHQSENPFPFWLLESYLVLPPALYFFVELNTFSDYRFKRIYLLAFVPAILEIMIETSNFVSGRLAGYRYPLMESSLWVFLTDIVPPVAMAGVLSLYGTRLFLLAKTHRSATSKINLQWLKLYGLFIVFTSLTTLWILEVFLHWPTFSYVEAISIIFLFVLGYVGYFTPEFFNLPAFLQRSEFAHLNDQDNLARLETLFSQKKVHKQPKLSLQEVALSLKLPPRYISYLINTYHETNFLHYVNRWRVKEVISLMNDPQEKHKTLLALALESGFNSKSSFNQIFKSHTGRTPSDLLVNS